MGALKVIKQAIGPDSVKGMERDLAKHNAKCAALAAEVERLNAQEEELGDAAELARVSFEAKAARNRLRKLEAEGEEIRQRLSLAKDAARAAFRDELLVTAYTAAWDLLSTARIAVEAMRRAVAAREALGAAAFERDYLSFAIPPGVNNNLVAAPDLLDLYQAALAGPQHGPARRYSNTPTLSWPEARERLRKFVDDNPTRTITTRGGHFLGVERVGAASAVPLAAPSRPALNETASEGDGEYVVIRPGLENPRGGGRVLRPGDIIALTSDEAMPLLRAGALDTAGGAE